MNPILKAIIFAKDAHKTQFRKYTNRPYITHPARVAMRVALLPEVTEEMICTAFLHDVCEDCDVSIAEIEEHFGATVASYVEGLTNTSKKDFPELNRSDRKKKDHEKIATRGCHVQNIKLCDRLDNLGELDLAGAGEDFYRLYLKESQELLAVLTKGDENLRSELGIRINSMLSELDKK